MRVKADPGNRAEVCQMAELFRAKVVDVQPGTLTIEITGGRPGAPAASQANGNGNGNGNGRGQN